MAFRRYNVKELGLLSVAGLVVCTPSFGRFPFDDHIIYKARLHNDL
jgi:hypothetical protein